MKSYYTNIKSKPKKFNGKRINNENVYSYLTMIYLGRKFIKNILIEHIIKNREIDENEFKILIAQKFNNVVPYVEIGHFYRDASPFPFVYRMIFQDEMEMKRALNYYERKNKIKKII